jgi:hypothetical protein
VKGVAELKFSLAALAMTVAVAGTITSAPHKSDGGAVVVQNYYYAKPGKADEVYRWRLHASDVRAKLGFARGRVLRRINTGNQTSAAQELPDVIWECEYPTIKDRERDASALSASPEFQAVQKHMGTLVRRFERGAYRVQP